MHSQSYDLRGTFDKLKENFDLWKRSTYWTDKMDRQDRMDSWTDRMYAV